MLRYSGGRETNMCFHHDLLKRETHVACESSKTQD
jgi:hypothetical protein